MALSLNDLSDAPFFTLNGQEGLAKIVKVYDADTVHALIEVLGTVYKWKCRIMHVDTPELRTRDENEKRHGYAAKEALSNLILNRIVKVKCFKFDMYGRVLGELTVISENENEADIVIHEWLLQNGYAHAYEGKTKEKWNFDA